VNYRIIIVKDNKKKKVLHNGKQLHNAKSKFFSLVDKNIVLFPKEHISYKKTKPVKYEILLLKEKEEDDPQFTDRDELGRTLPITTKGDSWTIVEKRFYEFEEKFSVFGYFERMEMKSILKKIFLPSIKTKGMVKQVNYIFNKVMIWHDNEFDIVTCKCTKDAKRFHNILRDFCVDQKINNVMFSGHVPKRNRTKMFKTIVEKTGWKIEKLYRTSTRP
jgi:hypothetical protein